MGHGAEKNSHDVLDYDDEDDVSQQGGGGLKGRFANINKKKMFISLVMSLILAAVIAGGIFFVLNERSKHAHHDDGHATEDGHGDDGHGETEVVPVPLPSVPLENLVREYSLRGHMASLMQIAERNNGSRDLPVGEGLTADYIMGAVAPYAGSYYSVNRLTFNIPYKRRLAQPAFAIDGDSIPLVVKDSPDNVWGDVTRVGDLDFDVSDAPMWFGNNGCDEGQWNATGVNVTGKIVVTDMTGYNATKKVPICGAAAIRAFAEKYGAKALIMAFIDETGLDVTTKTDYAGKMGYIHTTVNRGATGYNPVPEYEEGTDPFPVLYVREPAASKLKTAKQVTITLNQAADYMPASNVVVETVGGDPTQVVGVVAHIDGVTAGPGANDDGSGSVAALSIALAMAERNVAPVNRVRFVFVGGEELAVGGSYHYVKDHHRGDMVAAINMDMVGSINGRITICNGTTFKPDNFAAFGVPAPAWLAPEEPDYVRASSVALDNMFVDYLTKNNIPYTIRDTTKGSDQNNFQTYGVPATCLESGGGSYELLGDEWAAKLNALGLWEAKGDQMVDPCYHSACDNYDNINFKLMHIITKAIAGVLDQIAADKDIKTHINFHQVAPVIMPSSGLEVRVQEGHLRGLMAELMEVAKANGGNRATPDGEEATAAWIQSALKPHVDSGFYTVTPLKFAMAVKVRNSDPVMIIDGESLAFVPRDSPDNVFCDVSRVADLKLDVTGAPVYIGNGCDLAQWNSTDLKGKIVVTDQTGYPEKKKAPLCSAAVQRDFAQNAGAAALVMAFVDEEGTDIVGATDYAGKMGYMHACVNRGRTGYSPITSKDAGYATPFPVFYVREPYAAKAKTAKSMTLKLDQTEGTMEGQNLVVDTTGGNPEQVIGVNAHLDGVDAGPGANDDGSGTVAMLEVALAMAERGVQPKNRVRYVFAGGEEIAVFGSYDYLKNHHKGDLVASINMDMVGSKNGAITVCNGSTHDPTSFVAFGPAPPAYSNDGMVENVKQSSVILDSMFAAYLTLNNVPYNMKQKSKGSDQNNYQTFGVPASCLESGGGSYETLDAAMAAPIKRANLWNVVPGEMVDPCYHSACDNYDNINFGLMTAITRAIAGVVDILAGDEAVMTTLKFVKPNYTAA